MMMKGRMCRLVVIMICVMRVISSSRPLGPNDCPPTFVPTKQGIKTHIINSSQFSTPSKSASNSRFSTKDEEDMMVKNEDGKYGRGRIGSRPPSCEHKCYGCSPCEPTQVPTTTHVGIQYTNYEPEGWKCKCGPTFYSP